MLKRFIGIILTSVIATGLLSGCLNQTSAQEQIYSILEEAVKKEAIFKEQQAKTIELEKEEQAYYEEIIKLGLKEFPAIVELSDKALATIEERENSIEKEHDSIVSSQKEFGKIETKIKKIKDEELKKEATALVKSMEQRYEIHETLYDSYKKSLNHDKELYQLFKEEDLKMEELQVKVKEINQSYDVVIETNKKYNEATEASNKQKVKFYEKAELDIAENKKS